jgi:multicomponent Na+:H+ antiporter subunit E
MSQKIILFVAAFVVWCLLNWVPDGAHLLVGILVASLVAFLMGDLVIRRPHLVLHPRRYVIFLFIYVPVFLWEVLKANIDVAYRAVRPGLRINPGIVKVRTSLRSDIACTLLANSITLTPGTMSIDFDKDRAVLYVHWIDVRSGKTEAATRIIVERFEKILRRIFEEEQVSKGVDE